MKVVAAYFLAVLGSNTGPTADDWKKIFCSVGAEVQDDKTELFPSSVMGKDVNELIAAAREMLASASSAGGVGGGGGSASAEPKKEDKVEEKERRI